MQSLWEPVEFTDNEPRHWQVGPVQIWLCRAGSEWRVTWRYLNEHEDNEVSPEVREAPVDCEWQRFAVGNRAPVARILPVLPDRPVIVRPESDVQIVSDSSAQFFLMVPCSFRVLVGGKDSPGKSGPAEVALMEVPSMVLSNSWLGDFVNGELCYAMRTTARRSLDGVTKRPHRAVCTVNIHNTSSEHLHFRRLCLRVAPLSIYQADDFMWTNDVSMSYLGREEFGDLSYEQDQPKLRPGIPLLNEPRVPRHEWLQGRIRDIRSFIH